MGGINILGKCLGSCVINDYLILFTNDITVDRIYKIKPPNDIGGSDIILLFEGNLNFNQNNLIQTLPFYENDSIQKVYWIDGLNQPRVINIATEDGSIYDYSNTSFDFVQSLDLNEECSIDKIYNTGTFKSGVIQYAITYFNKNGAESNIFWISGINYISLDDRAGKPDEVVLNAFKISLENLENKYDYIRIYSIYRTSLDATPEVRSVVDLKIPTSGTLSYIDSGTSGSYVSSDLLLYIGGEELVPQCMSQKNNTLFLGNIELQNNVLLPATLVQSGDILAAGVPVHTSEFSWEENLTTLESSASNQSYPYVPFQSNVRHFKYDETYRFGIQGQFKSGKWSTPMWIGNDVTVDKRYKTEYLTDSQIQLKYITGKYDIKSVLAEWFLSIGFIKIRPVMVPLSYSDRKIIAQGLVNNTLGIMSNRKSGISNQPFAYPDYLLRTNGKSNIPKNYNGQYCHFDLLKLNNNLSPDGDNPNKYIEVMGNCDSWDYKNIYDNGTPPYGLPHTTPLGGDYDRDFFFVDKNMVNFWSPDLINNTDVLNSYVKNIKSVGLYGFAFETGVVSDFTLDFSDIDNTLDVSPLELFTNNYYNGSTAFDYSKIRRMFPRFVGSHPSETKDMKDYHCIPMWSPQKYAITIPRRDSLYQSAIYDIDFTKSIKAGFNYFGLNRTIKDGVSYIYDINNPYLMFNDNTIFYESNSVDNPSNNGNVLYSKNVEKNYPSGTYFNTVKYGTIDGALILSLRGLLYSQRIYDISESSYEEFPVNYGLAVKYNTNTHAMFSFKENNGLFATMPRIANTTDLSSIENYSNPNSWYRAGSVGFKTDIISRTNLNNPFSGDASINTLPIFDLYTNIDESTKYGGKTSDALYNNSWIVCGDAIRVAGGDLVLKYTIGDTYINRFDLLRVYPNDLNQIPQHSEIVSFICESFVNSDGRSDVNRYNTDSSLMTTGNYGLFNNVYSQKDNYFSYRILDPDLFNTSKYTNTIVWSKTKLSGATIDNWTGINMLSSIDLDGVYGEVTSINLFNNDLYAFQPNGIARLLFNERIQQQASDNISVELVNGYKVPEYRYLTNQYGAKNKWSIVEGKNGIYFIDYKNKSFNLLGEGVKDLSLQNGFKSWFNENIVNRNYTLSYDKINNDIYIHDDLNCLGYSESLNSFVSFYDYVKTIQMKNVWDRFISMKNNPDIFTESLQNSSGFLIESENELYEYISEASYNNTTSVWVHNSGEYNKFYDELKPFSIEYLFNPEPQYDKVFNTFEYRMDNQLIDWTDLSLNNWYQTAQCNSAQYKSRMKRKFNVNRVQLPRQNDTHNRIRSTWMKMKLQHTPTTVNNNNKFEMQDLNLTYTI